ncbi:MAG: hypothetical protein JRH20_00865 [Deltaproteobacteria bacterium]|nr:hypothetical protein [Deltaproteobacteria bacterium]
MTQFPFAIILLLSVGCARVGFSADTVVDGGTSPLDGLTFTDASDGGHASEGSLDGTIADVTLTDAGDAPSEGVASFDTATDQTSLPTGTSWLKTFPGPSFVHGRCVAVDGAGNIYVAGEYRVQTTIGGSQLSTVVRLYDIYLASFDAAGALRWAKAFVSDGAPSLVQGLAVDSHGNAYLVGQFKDTINFGGDVLVGSWDIFIASFTSAGVHRWSHAFGAAGGIDVAYGVAVDASDTVYITGEFGWPMSLGGNLLPLAGAWDMFLAAFDESGQHQWSKSFGGTDQDRPRALAVSNGRLAVHGQFSVIGDGPATGNVGGAELVGFGGTDLFVGVYSSSNGAHLWSKGFAKSQSLVPGEIDIDAAGDVYITGSYGSFGVNFGGGSLPAGGAVNAYLARLSTGGAHVWSKALGPVGGESEGHDVCVSGGNVYVTGSTGPGADFGGGLRDPPGVNGGVYVVSYDGTGTHRWSQIYGGALGASIAIAAPDVVTITGDFDEPLYFGGALRASAEADLDGFLLRRVGL